MRLTLTWLVQDDMTAPPPVKSTVNVSMILENNDYSMMTIENKIWSRFNSVLHSQKVLDLLVLCIVLLLFYVLNVFTVM